MSRIAVVALTMLLTTACMFEGPGKPPAPNPRPNVPTFVKAPEVRLNDNIAVPNAAIVSFEADADVTAEITVQSSTTGEAWVVTIDEAARIHERASSVCRPV